MSLPKYHETFIPILTVLRDGAPMHSTELRKRVQEEHYGHLPRELLEQRLKSGRMIMVDRIDWGRSYLKISQFIHTPQRGMVQISDKGRAALERGTLTLRDIRSDPDFMAHEAQKHQRKQSQGATNENDDRNSDSPQEMIESGMQFIEQQVRSELLDRLKDVDPYAFEIIVLQLLKCMGYGDVIETKKSCDGGIDGVINEDQLGLEKIYMQAKRYSDTKVRETDIRNFIGAMSGDTRKGIFVTTSTFDERAKAKAKEAHHAIVLIDGSKLAALMLEYRVGVQVRQSYDLVALDEDFFEE